MGVLMSEVAIKKHTHTVFGGMGGKSKYNQAKSDPEQKETFSIYTNQSYKKQMKTTRRPSGQTKQAT